MNPDEVIDLLTLIAAYDQRTVGESDVQAWHAIATEAGWTFPLARRAIIEHHTRGADRPRIRPAHITDALDALRTTIRRTVLRADLTPPRELADDPLAEIEWRHKTLDRATQAALNAWAHGQPLPQLEPAPEPTKGPPSEAVSDLIGQRFALRAPRRGEPADLNDRATRREAARRELDQVRKSRPDPDDGPDR